MNNFSETLSRRALSDSMTILIIDDEPAIRRAVVSALASNEMRVLEAGTATRGLELATTEHPALFLVDLGLPDGTGLDVCQQLRRRTAAPIVVLSAGYAESQKVALLEAGADDYVSKPFGMRELQARVDAHLRRAHSRLYAAPSVFEVDGLTIDLPRSIVMRESRHIRLTPTEWCILTVLARRAGRPVTHEEIFAAVWGRRFGDSSLYLRVYLTHLRRKIERNPSQPRVITTEPGIGYRLRHE